MESALLCLELKQRRLHVHFLFQSLFVLYSSLYSRKNKGSGENFSTAVTARSSAAVGFCQLWQSGLLVLTFGGKKQSTAGRSVQELAESKLKQCPMLVLSEKKRT